MRIIQICGKAPTHEPIPAVRGAERWIIGSAFEDHLGADVARVFDVHPFAWIYARRPEAWAWYRTQPVPVYLTDAHDDVPASVRYPRESLLRHFGFRASRALSSSVDQMMALALIEHPAQIRLDGVRLNSVEEWVCQRECLAYWIGRAEAMGIDIVTDDEAALVTPETIYGYDDKTGADRVPGQFKVVYGVPGGAVA